MILGPHSPLSQSMSDSVDNVPLPRLKEALDEKGRTQRGLAKFMGIHESNIARLIKGERSMLSPEQIRKIEEYTGKEFAYLADLKGACLSDDEVELLRKYREASAAAREIARFALSTKAD